MFNKKEYMKNYLKIWRKNNKEKSKQWHANYYEKNKEKLLLKMKKTRLLNKEKYNQTEKIWRKNNKEHIKEKNKTWYQKNKDTYNKKRKENRKNNPKIWETYEHRKEYLKNWQKQKRQKNLLYRLNSNISRRIRKDLTRFNTIKKESTQTLLPYTMQQLKEYIEKQFTLEMNWNNMGVIWEIDHSTPVSYAQNEKELIDLWALENLHPMLKQENREKQDSFSSNVKNTLSNIGR